MSGDSGNIGLCILPPQYEIQTFFLKFYNSRRLFNKRFTNVFLYDFLSLDSIEGNFRRFISYKANDIKMAPIINKLGKDVKAVGKYLEGVLRVKIIRTSEIPVWPL